MEKKRDLIQTALDTRNLKDIPSDNKIKKMELPPLPAGLFHSLATNLRFQQSMRENQVSFLRLLIADYRDTQIPLIETTLSKLIDNTKKEFTKMEFPEAAKLLFVALTTEKRKHRESLMATQTQATGAKSKPKKKQGSSNTRNDQPPLSSKSKSPIPRLLEKESFKKRQQQHDRKPYDRRGGYQGKQNPYYSNRRR
jgi:hypothetical protein